MNTELVLKIRISNDICIEKKLDSNEISAMELVSLAAQIRPMIRDIPMTSGKGRPSRKENVTRRWSEKTVAELNALINEYNTIGAQAMANKMGVVTQSVYGYRQHWKEELDKKRGK